MGEILSDYTALRSKTWYAWGFIRLRSSGIKHLDVCTKDGDRRCFRNVGTYISSHKASHMTRQYSKNLTLSSHASLFYPEDRDSRILETLAPIYQNTWRHVTEDHILRSLHCSTYLERSSGLNIEAAVSVETLVPVYRTTWSQFPGDRELKNPALSSYIALFLPWSRRQ
jgi:hypothetical protein